jgi:hypothetical protein
MISAGFPESYTKLNTRHLPLLYVLLGTGAPSEPVAFPVEGVDGSSNRALSSWLIVQLW